MLRLNRQQPGTSRTRNKNAGGFRPALGDTFPCCVRSCLAFASFHRELAPVFLLSLESAGGANFCCVSPWCRLRVTHMLRNTPSWSTCKKVRFVHTALLGYIEGLSPEPKVVSPSYRTKELGCRFIVKHLIRSVHAKVHQLRRVRSRRVPVTERRCPEKVGASVSTVRGVGLFRCSRT